MNRLGYNSNGSTGVNKLLAFTEIIQKHYPMNDIRFTYVWQEWRILAYVNDFTDQKIVHFIRVPEEWENITYEEFEQLIILDKL